MGIVEGFSYEGVLYRIGERSIIVADDYGQHEIVGPFSPVWVAQNMTLLGKRVRAFRDDRSQPVMSLEAL